MTKFAKLGSSSNANRNPYSKFLFEGTPACQEVFNRIEESRKLKTLELMSPEKWEEFCAKRKANA
jgi:hypothetical protein